MREGLKRKTRKEGLVCGRPEDLQRKARPCERLLVQGESRGTPQTSLIAVMVGYLALESSNSETPVAGFVIRPVIELHLFESSKTGIVGKEEEFLNSGADVI